MHDARTIALPIVCCVCPMHQTTVDGLFFAIISATLYTCASGTPQTSSTLSGVHLVMISSLTLSMPYTRACRYSLSSQPFLKMW